MRQFFQDSDNPSSSNSNSGSNINNKSNQSNQFQGFQNSQDFQEIGFDQAVEQKSVNNINNLNNVNNVNNSATSNPFERSNTESTNSANQRSNNPRSINSKNSANAKTSANSAKSAAIKTAAAATKAANKSNNNLFQQKEIDFFWKGKNLNGQIISGEIRAANEEEAQKVLKKRQVIQVSLQKLRVVKSKTITKKDITYFTRQLSILLKAGLPLLQAMDVVAQGHENASFSKLVADIKLNVQSGSSFSNALREHPRFFDDLYCNLIEAGEATGILDSLLERLATYKEKQLSLAAKIRNAMIYPAVVVLVVIAVLAIIMIWVIPTFKDIFASVGAELPLPTQIVMSISDFCATYWYLIIGIPLAAGWFYFNRLRKSEGLREWHDKSILRLPLFGEIFQKAAIARWSRTFSTMFGAGVPIIDALESVSGSAGNVKYSQATQFIQQEVIKGSGLTTAMRQTQMFPNMVTQMVASGEESGSLDKMLDKVGDFYEEEVDNKVQALSTIIEPVIIVFLGVVICVILVAMYLPLFKLGEAF